MLTLDNMGRKLWFNDFSQADLSIFPVSFLAVVVSFVGLQPLGAEETSSFKTSKFNSSESKATIQTSPKQQQDSVLIFQRSISELEIFEDLIVVNDADNIPEQIVVKNFDVVGSSVFSPQELDQVVQPYRNRPLTLSELFQARSAITTLYTEKGFVSSGAYIPPQELNDGTVQIAVLEGKLEEINISGTKHLSDNYISSRIAAAGREPINVDALLSALQLLRLDPLIDNVSAELSAGIRPGTSLLDIRIEEADVFNIATSFNNSRSPAIGTSQRSVGLNHGNLLGFGDQFNFDYANTDGSNAIDVAYGFPVNAKNGTIKAAYGINSNNIIEEPFSPIDIESKSRYYELSLRQPLLLQPTTEFSLGLSLTRTESETSLLDESFQLSRGANEDGETKISAVRFFQEFVDRNDQEVLAFRSQFSLGVDVLNPTINDDAPDSTFLSWRGQSQWIKQLDQDFLLLLRGDAQIAGGSLVPLEQFRVGGVDSARGYRQDLSLGDNGLFASAELRIPILRFKKVDGLVQIAPFFDVGTVWNNDEIEISNAILPSVGVGLNFSMGTNFNARLDWGIPLTSVGVESDSLQEDGIYFSIDSNFF